MAAVVWLIVFCGAFFEQLLFGSTVGHSGVSSASKALNSLAYIPVYLCTIILFIQSLTDKRNRVVYRDYLPFLFFAGYSIISSMWALDGQGSIVDSTQLLITTIGCLGLGCMLSAEVLGRTFVRVLIFLMIVSIFYVYAIPSIGRMHGVSFSGLTGMAQGVFSHKNRYAEVASFGIIFAIGVETTVRRFERVLLILLAGFSMVISGSAAKGSSLFFTLALFVVWRLFRSSAAGRVGWFLLLIYVLIFAGVLSQIALPVVTDFLGKDDTLSGRTEIWSHARSLIQLRPFFGYGAASVWGSAIGQIPGVAEYRPPHSHNLYLEMMLRYGGVGMALIIWCIFSIIRQLVQSKGRSIAHDLLFLTFIVTIIRSPFDVTLFRDNQISYGLLILLFVSSSKASMLWRLNERENALIARHPIKEGI
ncbi:O-antigen ligase family protein [Novosphingobium soli]